jgi:ubiquinone/menaquinone biosynthesis C-methylase UbiE
MPFTGERYVPSEFGSIRYEHFHRYAACASVVSGKDVLDIASGEGYGTALLSLSAASVVGVDVDASTVDHSTRAYGRQNAKLRFMQGSCDAVPLADASVDVVVSFETIEHHSMHREMMLEVKRVLRPSGIFILSSPNRVTYRERAGQGNPFHVKELDLKELEQLLRDHFAHIRLFGQKVVSASFIYALDNGARELSAYTGDSRGGVHEGCSLSSPIFFVTMCSDSGLELDRATLASVYVEAHGDPLEGQEWFARCRAAAEDLTRVAPGHSAYILIDQNQLRDRAGKSKAIPFLERAGSYWGPPPDGSTAVRELRRLMQSSAADAVIVAWPAFWWLEHYTELREYLWGDFRRTFASENLIVFEPA